MSTVPQRLSLHLLRAREDDTLALAEAIREVEDRIRLCEGGFHLADGAVCLICADQRRDPELICVVEEPSDVISIGRMHVLPGGSHILAERCH